MFICHLIATCLSVEQANQKPTNLVHMVACEINLDFTFEKLSNTITIGGI
jgi:hypothetical protein